MRQCVCVCVRVSVCVGTSKEIQFLRLQTHQANGPIIVRAGHFCRQNNFY
uniref:Uncharacterized protein n=1 Tax=Anguilla anguilla TaxID=7936 RepID=A0A0E9PA51_ANGAN